MATLEPQFVPLDDIPQRETCERSGWSEMDSTERIRMMYNMQRYGGSFARKIGEAFSCADDCNAARLAAAFPELVEKYGTGWPTK